MSNLKSYSILICSLLAMAFTACEPQTSKALENGSPAPDFTLTDTNGEKVTLSALKGKVVVLEWFNYGCPFVRKHYDVAHMQKLQKEFGEKEVVWLTINSTGTNHRDFQTAEETNKLIEAKSIAATHVLLDSDGVVGKTYAAKTTPHMYIVDPEGVLVYQGAIDDAPDTDSDPAKSTNYLEQGVTAVLAGNTPDPAETKPYGCSVKYSS